MCFLTVFFLRNFIKIIFGLLFSSICMVSIVLALPLWRINFIISQCMPVMLRQAEEYGRLALYETEDLPYRRDAEKFMVDYTEERKKQHARMMAAGN